MDQHFFTIFINDIPDGVQSNIKIFADDTKIYNQSVHKNILQEDLDHLAQWSDKWLLPFNVEKCKVLHYGRTNQEYQYIMNTKVLPNGSAIKDLGITFQNNLKFDDHISNICKTARSRLGVIKYTFQVIDREGFLILFKSNVRPILEYGTQVWFPFLRKHDKELEQIQRRATIMIHGYKNLSYPERLRKLNLPTLYYRRRRSDLIQVFRIIKKIDDISADSLFDLNLGVTRKNHIYKLNKPRSMTSQKMHSFSHRTINDWNDLPESVGVIDNINSFKSLLEKHWKGVDFKFEFKF